MGNHFSCSEILCSDNIYEMNWINEKNWKIDYDYSEKDIPYKVKKGNFKIINNGNCFFKLIKKIEYFENIQNILINFLFDFNLNKNNNVKIKLILTNNQDELLNNVINTINIKNNCLEINNQTYEIPNNFNYQLLINLSYFKCITFNEIIKNNNGIISNINLNRFYEEKYDDLYFIILISSNLQDNNNMDNYLNLKIT